MKNKVKPKKNTSQTCKKSFSKLYANRLMKTKLLA